METWRHGDGEMRRLGDGTRRLGDYYNEVIIILQLCKFDCRIMSNKNRVAAVSM
jgi:hypothetical protein